MRVPGAMRPTSEVKSPKALIVNSGRSGRAALELYEKGCSRSEKGASANFNQANWPGLKGWPEWPSASSSKV